MAIVAMECQSGDESALLPNILQFVFARLDSSARLRRVVHLAHQRSLLVLKIRDCVVMLQRMSI